MVLWDSVVGVAARVVLTVNERKVKRFYIARKKKV